VEVREKTNSPPSNRTYKGETGDGKGAFCERGGSPTISTTSASEGSVEDEKANKGGTLTKEAA